MAWLFSPSFCFSATLSVHLAAVNPAKKKKKKKSSCCCCLISSAYSVRVTQEILVINLVPGLTHTVVIPKRSISAKERIKKR